MPNPSPPSLMGSLVMSSLGFVDSHPFLIASAASVADRVPLNLSGAMRIFRPISAILR